MSHPIHRVTGFRLLGAHVLAVAFNDGTEQRIDFAPVLGGEMFGALTDPALFTAVRLDEEGGHWCGRTVRTSTLLPSTTGPRCEMSWRSALGGWASAGSKRAAG